MSDNQQDQQTHIDETITDRNESLRRRLDLVLADLGFDSLQSTWQDSGRIGALILGVNGDRAQIDRLITTLENLVADANPLGPRHPVSPLQGTLFG